MVVEGEGLGIPIHALRKVLTKQQQQKSRSTKLRSTLLIGRKRRKERAVMHEKI